MNWINKLQLLFKEKDLEDEISIHDGKISNDRKISFEI